VIRRDGIEKDIIQGKVKGKRSRCRPPIRYIDQIKISHKCQCQTTSGIQGIESSGEIYLIEII